MKFEPRRVPSSSMRTWFVEGLDLSRRRIVAFMFLSVVFYAGLWLAAAIEAKLLGVVLFPLALALGCAIARSGDESLPAQMVIMSIGMQAWLRVALLAAAPWVGLELVVLVLRWLGGDAGQQLEQKITKANEVTATSSDVVLLLLNVSVIVLGIVFLFYVLMRITSMLWFLWTLCAVADLPAGEAIAQSMDGVDLNRFVIWPYTLTSFAFLAPILQPLLILPWLAITCSMLYVSYRDIWLHRTKNSPAKVPSVVGVQQTVPGL